MTKTTAAAASFSLSDFEDAETGKMTVSIHGRPTDWVWTFAGPGHPQTIEQANRLAKERLHEDRLNEQRRLNGKKVVLPEESVDDVRAANVKQVVDRLIGWSPVVIDGADYPFTPENAFNLLIDRRRPALLIQAMEFLAAENSFTPRSAGT
jgi:hypothetical protein